MAAALALGHEAIGMEIDPRDFKLAQKAIPQLAALYPAMKGEKIDWFDTSAHHEEFTEQLALLEPTGRYRV